MLCSIGQRQPGSVATRVLVSPLYAARTINRGGGIQDKASAWQGLRFDCSGRPGLEYQVSYPRARVGEFDIDLIAEFFQGFVNHAGVSLHIDTLRGRNTHHIAETIFKAFGRALRLAVEPDPRMAGVLPSTKGTL